MWVCLVGAIVVPVQRTPTVDQSCFVSRNCLLSFAVSQAIADTHDAGSQSIQISSQGVAFSDREVPANAVVEIGELIQEYGRLTGLDKFKKLYAILDKINKDTFPREHLLHKDGDLINASPEAWIHFLQNRQALEGFYFHVGIPLEEQDYLIIPYTFSETLEKHPWAHSEHFEDDGQHRFVVEFPSFYRARDRFDVEKDNYGRTVAYTESTVISKACFRGNLAPKRRSYQEYIIEFVGMNEFQSVYEETFKLPVFRVLATCGSNKMLRVDEGYDASNHRERVFWVRDDPVFLFDAKAIQDIFTNYEKKGDRGKN